MSLVRVLAWGFDADDDLESGFEAFLFSAEVDFLLRIEALEEIFVLAFFCDAFLTATIMS
jgi:hypothetical protein